MEGSYRWLHLDRETRFVDRLRDGHRAAVGVVACVGGVVIFVARGQFGAALMPAAVAVGLVLVFIVTTNGAGPKRPSALTEQLRKAHRQ